MRECKRSGWVSAVALSFAVGHGGYLLLRPRHGTIAAGAAPPARYFTATEVERARAYERPQLALGALAALIRAASLAALVRERPGAPLAGQRPPAAGARAMVLVGALSLQSLPFAALARRRALAAGLATQSWRDWAFDVARAEAIGSGFAFAAGAGACLLVRRYGERWWAAGAVGSLAGAALLSFAGPVVLEPIFNDFTPLPDGELRRRVLELAQHARVPVGEVLVVDASRRTSALNAYVSGFGPTRRVVLFDTLTEAFSPAQVEVVVAHELAHVHERDVLRGLAFAALLAPVGARAAARVAQRLDSAGDGPTIPSVALAAGIVATLLGPIARRLSRAIERRADSFALELTDDPNAFIAFEQQVTRTNLADPDPPRWRSLLLATHPPAVERIGLAAAYAAGARTTAP
ncbi:MAG: M48 family metalloprotease [Solirubrobacteraceae bacterium]|jgi:STE24 endopeptidase